MSFDWDSSHQTLGIVDTTDKSRLVDNYMRLYSPNLSNILRMITVQYGKSMEITNVERGRGCFVAGEHDLKSDETTKVCSY